MKIKPGEYVTTAEAADEAGVSERHMRLLATKGKIAAVQIGRNWLVSKAAAKAFRRHPSKGRPAAAAE